MRLGREAFELDLYEILGVSRTASFAEIRIAYRRSARQSHPDLNPHDARAGERMARVNLAGRVLLDPYLRGAYDRTSPASTAPRTAWYERPASRGSTVASDEWVSPPRPRRYAPRERSTQRFVRELRTVPARASATFDEFMSATPVRARAPLFALCMAVALLLIASARPRPLFASPGLASQPTTIAPSALDP